MTAAALLDRRKPARHTGSEAGLVRDLANQGRADAPAPSAQPERAARTAKPGPLDGLVV
jgi:hypothetical protein